MSYQWTAFEFKSKIIDQLEQNATLQAFDPEVRVLPYAPSIDEVHTDVVVIGAFYRDQELEPQALGQNRYDERVELGCGIRIVRPGAGQDVSDEAEKRARDILAVVSEEVQTNWPKVGNQTLRAQIAGRELDLRAYMANGTPVRVCDLDFQILYSARTSPS